MLENTAEATLGTQDEEKQNKNIAKCNIEHYSFLNNVIIVKANIFLPQA
jgi:hypothetical protein